MENVIEKLYFQPVNPHQYWHKQVIAQDEGQSQHFDGVLRLTYFYVDYGDNLSLLVVFRREGEYHADRVLAYHAVIGPAARLGDPHKVVPSLAEAADSCENYWKSSIASVFGDTK